MELLNELCIDQQHLLIHSLAQLVVHRITRLRLIILHTFAISLRLRYLRLPYLKLLLHFIELFSHFINTLLASEF